MGEIKTPTCALNAELVADALDGLGSTPKWMSPKWFYDDAGSALFEKITRLPEYYPTRTEVSILSTRADALAAHVPDGTALVELGSGASVKSRLLLNALPRLGAYVPVDISEPFLLAAGARLAADYAKLEVVPVAGDFTQDLVFPPRLGTMEKVAFFPGSTLGNLGDAEASALLQRVRGWSEIRAFILGIDLVKDADVLVRAYDDSAGVTAAFNRNLLDRLNREAGADFDTAAFAHRAVWNDVCERIEMHLVSRTAQRVCLGGTQISFDASETIHTESSRKYTPQKIRELAERTGWRADEFLTDDREYFAVVVMVPEL